MGGFFGGGGGLVNDFNLLSSFDLVDDFSQGIACRFLNQDNRNGAFQGNVGASEGAGIYNTETHTNTNGASGLSGALSYRFSTFSRLSIAANMRVLNLADGTNSYRIILGFNSSNSAADSGLTRSAAFYYSNSNANWQAITYNASTGTTTDTGIAAVADGSYNTFCVRANGDTSVEFFINDSLVATNTTNIPSSFVAPYICIAKTAGSTSRTIRLDWVRFSGSGNTRSLGVSA
jgi:hypothetical protein